MATSPARSRAPKHRTPRRGDEAGRWAWQAHYGVSLWVPEVGGRVDPDSEAHDLLMSLFGGLAKAERNRIRHRVRAAMAAHACSGRWLGGRPPYGYRLIDAGPHPNPDKAAAGVRLHALDPDPSTAPIVQRIFDLYVNGGQGFKAIAALLSAGGIPSPSASDRQRNSHRPGHAWASSAVRTILANPRYLGRHVFGRQRRHELLLDPNQPALGHTTRMRWQAATDWVVSEVQTHTPLVTEDLFQVAQMLMRSRGREHGGGSPRSAPGRYALAGILLCHHCGRRMQGSHTRGRPLYRCRLSGGDYARPPDGHPRTLTVREDRILPVLDEWLLGLFTPERIHDVAIQVAAADASARREDPAVQAARRTVAEARRKIDRYLAGLEAGIDPALVADRTRRAQAELAAAQAVIDCAPEPPNPLTVEEVLETLEAVRELPELLDDADTALRGQVYGSLGVTLAYRRDNDAKYVKVHASIESVDLERVGGGT